MADPFTLVATGAAYGLMSIWKKICGSTEDPKEQIVAGAFCAQHYHAIQMSQRRFGPANENSLFFGGVPLAPSEARYHFCVLGSPGSGKTVTIRMLMLSAAARIQAGDPNTRAFIYDHKREDVSFLKTIGLDTGRHVKILNPFHNEGVAWDMCTDIPSYESSVAFDIARILLPVKNKEPFFDEAASELIARAMQALSWKAEESGSYWELLDLVRETATVNSIRNLIRSCPLTRHARAELLDPNSPQDDRTIANVLGTLRQAMGPLEAPAALWSGRPRYSLKKWTTDNSILVVQKDNEREHAVDTINQFIFHRLAQYCSSMPKDSNNEVNNWIFLDEVRHAGHLAKVHTLMTTGRDRGTAVVLGFQNINGMWAAYKSEKLANEICEEAAHMAVFRCEGHETANWAAKQFGKVEFFRTDESISFPSRGGSTVSYHEVRETLDTVRSGAIQYLEPTSKTTGLLGFYRSPKIGVWHGFVPGHLFPPLANEAKYPGFVMRDDLESVLRNTTFGSVGSTNPKQLPEEHSVEEPSNSEDELFPENFGEDIIVSEESKKRSFDPKAFRKLRRKRRGQSDE